jgi:uncharacterized OsmC-like protein
MRRASATEFSFTTSGRRRKRRVDLMLLLAAHLVAFGGYEPGKAGFTVTESHLDLTAKIPGIDQAKFTAIANGAKAGCPISRLLKANTTLDAKLEA